jgi:two-component system phosphate regulon sensor histidine kinase PhoR
LIKFLLKTRSLFVVFLLLVFFVLLFALLLVVQLADRIGLTGYIAALYSGLVVAVLGIVVLAWKLQKVNDSSLDRMDFMYKMTHELQTPVSSIRLAADMLGVPAVLHTPERANNYLRIIREESQRMQSHVENVLNIAKAEGDLFVLRPEIVPINDLVHNLICRYNGVVKADCRARDSLIYADRLHLTNLLHNLLDNAIKYSPDSPEVEVLTKSTDSTLVISVKDKGIGIAPKDQEKIFAKFYRVEGGENVKGFGLGLSYVQQIVTAHQWHLKLDSEPGKGSEFQIVIPRTEVPRTDIPRTDISGNIT